MSKQPLRGSISSAYYSIAETLELVLEAAKDETDLRKMVSSVAFYCRSNCIKNSKEYQLLSKVRNEQIKNLINKKL